MVVSKYDTPRSVVIRDENEREKRRNFIDVITSENKPNFIQVNYDEDCDK